MTVIPHPPYSPDLAPCDFSLFRKLKLLLKGLYFDTIKAIQAELQAVLDIFTEADFQRIFEEEKKWWDRCIHVGGNYFEEESN